jgi:hypothetical protein
VFREVSRRWVFNPWPDVEGEDVNLRLVISGPLPRPRGNSEAKHRIRQQLNRQLRDFFQSHPMLRGKLKPDSNETRSVADQNADGHRVGAFRFLPLVELESGVGCALDVLILRRDHPFELFTDTGDIDNRVKTLLDGLKKPTSQDLIWEVNSGQREEAKPEANEDPFFVLLEDDKVVTDLNVTTDKLLVPTDDPKNHGDVLAIVKVKTRVVSGAPQMNVHFYE